MSESLQTPCVYTVLDGGVHEFVLYEFSRGGVDAFIDEMLRMNASLPQGIARPMLVDSQRGIPPLRYLFARLQEIERASPQRERSRLAVILMPGVMTGIIGGMLRVFPLLNARFFRPDAHDAALAWLRS